MSEKSLKYPKSSEDSKQISMCVKPKARPGKLIFSALVLCLFCACSPNQRSFEAELWRTGGKSARGSMVADIRVNNILTGKSKLEVKNLLGRPAFDYSDALYYEVNTIPRCYLWKCRMEILFDENDKVSKIDVSD